VNVYENMDIHHNKSKHAQNLQTQDLGREQGKAPQVHDDINTD